MYIVWILLIGLVAGWLAGKLTRGESFGLVGDIVLGILGAIVGGALLRRFGFAGFGLVGLLVSATLGAVVLITVVRLIKRA